MLLLFTGSYGADQKASADGITSGNRISLSFDFPDLRIGHSDSYDLIIMPELDDYGETGSPILPYKTIKILLPQGEEPIDIKVTPNHKTTLKGSYFIKPAQEFYPISFNGTVSFTLPNPAIYNSTSPYPGTFYSDVSIQKLYGYDILIFNLYPVHYIPETGQVYYFQNMEVDILTEPTITATSLESIQKNNFRGLLKDEEKIRNIVDNPDTLQTYDILKTTLTNLSAASEPTSMKPLSIVNPADSYDYIIITNTALNSSFQALIYWKTQKGLNAKSVLVEDIYSNYTGIDNQDKIRNFIIDAYNNWNIEFVLLGGDDNIIPHRGFYVDMGDYTDYDIPSDLYYAALSGTWDNDLDGIWGEPGEEDFFAEVYVGRAPVDNEAEVNNFINKTIAYENLSGSETYLKKALMAGEKLDSSTWGGDSKDEISNYLTSPWTPSTLYDRDYPGNDWPKSDIISRMNQGQHLINHMGHASTLYALKLYNSDINSITSNEHFLVYTQGCYPGAFDNRGTSPSYYYSEDSFCENLVKKSEYGAFAAICNSRYGWYSPGSTNGASQIYDREFFDAIFNENIRNVGWALQDSKEDNAGLAASYPVMRWVYYELNLLGDPETSIHIPLAEPHDISLTHLEAQDSIRLNDLVHINATVNNVGQNDENNIEITFLVDGNPEDSQIIFNLASGSSQKMNFTWSTSIEGNYNLSIYAVPVPGEVITSNNMLHTDILASLSDILLIDDDGGDNYETYYSDALDYFGYPYIIWNVSSQGSPSASDLQSYKIVIWLTGSEYINTLTAADQVNLQSFLNSGGKLFIAGQDIGYDIGVDSFYNNYLHSNFEWDNANIYNLLGVSGDPVTHGIDISISGGDGANNQLYPSEISPYDEYSTPIFYYDGDGIGAIRADTGTYRVVYFAFGFEAINNSWDRAYLLYKIINWLDITPPSVYVSNYGATYVPAGSPVTINAVVYDMSDISSVYAEIESPDENIVTTIQLFDDGMHYDGSGNDGIYGNSWVTDPEEKEYNIDFIATDTWGNTGIHNDSDRFTTVPLSFTSDIILVDGSSYSSYINYFEDALDTYGYSFNLWDFDLRGEIDSSTMDSFKICIWSSPFNGPDSNEQSVLREFLDNGGKLFISGQDIGWDIGGTNFYQDYLHANYIQDDVNLYALEGTSGDPITNGIDISIIGGDGANNQWWPCEIDPIAPAESIFYYDITTSLSEKNYSFKKLPPTLNDRINKTLDYETSGISSTGTGALRVDNGTYRIVYFAFGFEAINDIWDRAYLMSRVIEWLDITPPSVYVSGDGVTFVPPGNSIIINANIYDNNGVSSVFAEIESPDENVIATIQLFDDGMHFDGSADDGLYSNSWTTEAEEKEYYIDFTATDNLNNIGLYDNLDMFTTVSFSTTLDILLVDDSYYDSYIDYYKDALNSNAFSYELWSSDLRGEINGSTINSFAICIWSSPFSGPNSNEQSVLREFLDNGGGLFISGQDIGYSIGGTNFYQDYLHAIYTQDDVNLYTLNGISGDPISNGIEIGIAGGDGANNQWWPSEIDPISPAKSIFLYDNTSLLSEKYPNIQNYSLESKILINKTIDIESSGIYSTGNAGLRVEIGNYRIIYFAFGFEAINSSDHRNIIMKRTINWLDRTPPEAVGVYDNAGTWALWNGISVDIVGFGWPNTEPVVGDWDGDGTTEVGIYNTGGNNFLIQTDSGFDLIGLGWEGVTPVVGDWNGDGSDDVGVYDNMGTWALWNGASADIVGFGWPGTEPVVGDWDGDGFTEVGIYNRGGNNFLIQTDSGFDVIGLGWSGVTPVISDWNGDGSDQVGVYDNMGTWALWNGAGADIVGFGWPGTEPVVGDWDSDGASEVGIYNTGGNNFFIQTDSGPEIIGLGWSGVTPVVGSWV